MTELDRRSTAHGLERADKLILWAMRVWVVGARERICVDEVLRGRDVLYAPDYVINAGGVISVAHEYLGGDNPAWVTQRIDTIDARLTDIFEQADRARVGTQAVADELARGVLADAARKTPQLAVVA